MNHPSSSRYLAAAALATLAAAVLSPPARLAGQTPAAARGTPPAARNWTPPRTPDGQPDLQGIWTNATLTPLERLPEFAGKEYLTPQEAAEHQKRVLERWDRDNRGGGAAADLGRAYGSEWWDADAKIVPMTRTSLIVDPADGKIPPLTPAAQRRLADARDQRQLHPADGPEDRPLMDRCLWWPAVGPPMLPSFANNSPYHTLVTNYQFMQVPGSVVIVNEILHLTRFIPLDGRPHLSPKIRQWMGDSRGRWEGNTLVVETTNIDPQMNGMWHEKSWYSRPTTRVIERYTRVDENTIDVRFTIDDLVEYTRPWTVALRWTTQNAPDRILEYGCHEGNYGLTNILSGARVRDKEAAEKAAASKTPGVR